MNKEEYIKLHTILSKIRYELEMELLEVSDFELIQDIRKQIAAIDEVMKIFIVECE